MEEGERCAEKLLSEANPMHIPGVDSVNFVSAHSETDSAEYTHASFNEEKPL
jgi:hypothetical protein